MISGYRNFLWILPLLIFAATPLWKPLAVNFLSPRGFTPIPDRPETSGDSFDLTGVRLSRSVNGKEEIMLEASQVNSNGGMHDFYFRDIDFFLFEDGVAHAHVTGGEGAYDAEKEIVTIIDDVVVLLEDNYQLKTDFLRYIIPYKTIKTAADIYFQSQNATVQGTGLSYNLSSGRFRVGGRVICDLF